ncbi:MAG: hypothetical protein ABIU20_07860, partial [Blastocatellia bacterium]
FAFRLICLLHPLIRFGFVVLAFRRQVIAQRVQARIVQAVLMLPFDPVVRDIEMLYLVQQVAIQFGQ